MTALKGMAWVLTGKKSSFKGEGLIELEKGIIVVDLSKEDKKMTEIKRGSIWAALSIFGAFVIGIAGFCAGTLAVLNEYNYLGAGLSYLTGAVAFGLTANARFRQ